MWDPREEPACRTKRVRKLAQQRSDHERVAPVRTEPEDTHQALPQRGGSPRGTRARCRSSRRRRRRRDQRSGGRRSCRCGTGDVSRRLNGRDGWWRDCCTQVPGHGGEAAAGAHTGASTRGTCSLAHRPPKWVCDGPLCSQRRGQTSPLPTAVPQPVPRPHSPQPSPKDHLPSRSICSPRQSWTGTSGLWAR